MSSHPAKGQRKRVTPLAYLLTVMNDPAADPARRDKLAIAAAPYVHPRADSVPKKARQATAAEKAGAGTPWAGDLDGNWPE
jgi:phage terminase small subunit